MPKKGLNQNNIINDPDEDILEEGAGGGEEGWAHSYHLPTPDRAARKQMLADLDALMDDAFIQDILGYQKYLTEMKALDKQMDTLSELNAWGLPKPLTAEDKAALEAQMQKTALAGEAFLSNVKKTLDQGQELPMNKDIPGMAAKLQRMLSHDYAAMQDYDPKGKPLSLPEVMENARTKTIMLGKKKIQSMGGAQSSRIPMSLVNEKGKIRKGFLTKANTMDVLKVYKRALSDAAQEAGTLKAEEKWEGFLKQYREYKKIGPDKSDEYAVGHLLATTFSKKNAEASTLNFKLLLAKMKIKATDLDVHAIDRFVRRLQPLHTTATSFKSLDLELRDGDRIDRRNSAMSSVADLLGTPNLIARSTDMKFTDEEGNVVEGTFMDFAKGLDLASGKKKYYQQIGNDPFSYQGESAAPGALLKQIADIQVLDYICGNLDRHFGNLLYQVDDNGRIIGIQGIDNDTSLGLNLPGGKNDQRLAGTDNMGVITASMAEKIKKLSPEMLKFTLRGRGLSEAQLDSAALRLGQLKAAVKEGEEYYKDKPIGKDLAYEEGHLRVVPDEDFAKLKIHQLCPDQTDKNGWYKNLYGEIRGKTLFLVRDARRKGASFMPKEQRPEDNDQLEQVDAADKTLREKLSPKTLRESVSGIGSYVKFNAQKQNDLGGAKNIDELTHGKNGSQAFADMVKAVKHLGAVQEHFKRLEDGSVLSLQEYKHYYEQLKGAFKEVNDTQKAYLDFKMGEKKVDELGSLVGKNEYERNRIKFAKSVRQFVNRCEKKMEKLEDPDSFVNDPEEIRAQELRRDMEERKAAMEALKKLHAEKGLDSPEEIKKAQKGPAF